MSKIVLTSIRLKGFKGKQRDSYCRLLTQLLLSSTKHNMAGKKSNNKTGSCVGVWSRCCLYLGMQLVWHGGISGHAVADCGPALTHSTHGPKHHVYLATQ